MVQILWCIELSIYIPLLPLVQAQDRNYHQLVFSRYRSILRLNLEVYCLSSLSLHSNLALADIYSRCDRDLERTLLLRPICEAQSLDPTLLLLPRSLSGEMTVTRQWVPI